MGRLVGYARVPTNGQTVDAEVQALEIAGAEVILRGTANGARTDRTQLAKAIVTLGRGDTLVVTRLDRLARSTRDLLNTLDAVAGKGATFKSLVGTWADTTTPYRGPEPEQTRQNDYQNGLAVLTRSEEKEL